MRASVSMTLGSNNMKTLLSVLTLLSVCALHANHASAQESAGGVVVAQTQVNAPPPAPYPPAPPPPPGAQPAYPQQAYPQQAPQQAYPQQQYAPPQQQYAQPYPQQQYAQPYPQQAPYSALPPAARRPRLSKGLLIAGTVVLSVSYGIALVTGTALLDSSCCEDTGATMLIPVVGPFVAASTVDHGKSVLTLLGAVEVIGTGLLIGGIVKYVSSKRAAEADGYYTWQLPHGRKLSLDATTSPRMAGPNLRLTF